MNGSRLVSGRGVTNGRGAARRRRAGRAYASGRRRLLAGGTAAALLLPALFMWLGAEGAPVFAADGTFGEWASVGGVLDSDDAPFPHPEGDLQEVRVAASGRSLFVFARAAGALFSGDEETVMRIFVDGDADRLTGFDLGTSGADLMIEAAGARGSLLASGLYRFEAGRGADDWRGWAFLSEATLGMDGDRLEAAVPGVREPDHAPVVVALDNRGGSEDLLSAPAAAGGTVAVSQAAGAPGVVREGEARWVALHLRFEAWALEAGLVRLALAPSGGANFAAVAQARLTVADLQVAGVVSPDEVSFAFEAPVAVGKGAALEATVEFDMARGAPFVEFSGSSFGASVSDVRTAADRAFVALSPRELAPASYLGFVSPSPVVDGAFGEWSLATADGDPLDMGEAPGGDLVGTRALRDGTGAAFYAEARGPTLAGATLSGLPLHVALPAPAAPSTVPPSARDPVPATERPPLSADDRLLVYIDADGDPRTGFAPLLDFPLGAEFLIEVGGRFSFVRGARLLAFTGASAFESSWSERARLAAVAHGPSMEGEIPALALSMGSARLLFQTVSWSGRTQDLSDTLQEVAAAPSDPDDLLHFRSVVFDPLMGPPAVRPSLLAADPQGYYVVQLEDAPTTARVAALEAAGARLFGYIHSNAYVARMDEEAASAARAMAGVRWVGAYEPAFKFPVDPLAWGEATLTLLALLFERPAGFEQAVVDAGGRVLSSTDSSMRVSIPGSSAEALGHLPWVEFVEVENRRVPLNDIARRLQGVNLTFDSLGLNGSGIVVGISDSGIDFTHPAFDDTGNTTSGPLFNGRILGYFRYGGAYGDSDGHGTHTAGSIAGDGDLSSTVSNTTAGGTYQFRGAAPAAALVVTEILGTAPPSDEAVFADQQAYGATVSSNSWGYVDGSNHGITNYDAAAYLTDLSVIDSNASRSGFQPMTIVFAAGNDGSLGANSLGTPGTSKNVITVGASETDRLYDAYSDNPNTVAVFSSRGPTDDARIKPDVVAVGTYILSAQSRTPGCTCTYGMWDESWTGANYAFSSGTSQATPHVAGLAALIQQYYNNTFGRIPSPAFVKASLINGAEDLGYGFEFTGGVTGPMSQGWGRVNVSRSIAGPPGGRLAVFDEGPAVGSGDVLVRRFAVSNASTPLKVTLVWTDPAGNPLDTVSLPELVNDLDLVVRAPNGTYYHGNKFSGAWSRANNTSFDRLNNVENVFVQSPAVGTWTVEVSGFSIKASPQQYALIASGNLTEVAPVSVADVHAVPGAPAGSKFGWNATAAGSLNGDAYTDLAVGAPGASGGNGSVYLFFGGPSADFSGFNVSRANVTLNGSAAEGFGWSLDSSGDFNGDGRDDLLVGAPSSGKAYLFAGSSDWSSPAPSLTFTGSSSELFGAAVRLAPVDSAPGAEAAVGAPLATSSTGKVFLFSGGGATGSWGAASANATLTGPSAGSRLGTALGAGDLDGDGYLDLAAGAPGACVVRVARGGAAPSALAFNATVTGLPGSAFGNALSLDGDYNDDGKADILVGAPLANASTGAAYVFFGRSPLADDQVIRSYFFDDMESGASKWVEMSGTTVTSTGWGLTSAVYAGDATSGNSWQDSSGFYVNNADTSIAFSAAVNLSAATAPVLTFVYREDTEEGATNWDGFRVLYSTNNGSSWTHLDSTNTQGNYDTTIADPNGNPPGESAIAGSYAFIYDRPQWRPVTFNLSVLAGSASVKLRFQFVTDGAVAADGVYLDDIALRESSPSSPNYTVFGARSGDRFGASVASLGDASGDGVDDLAVGAPYAGQGFVPSSGAAFAFTGSGALNGTTRADAAAESTYGPADGSLLGWSMAPIAGYNGSGAVFLFVGAPGAGGGAGGGTVGDASAAIPEFGELVVPATLAAGLALIERRRRRRPTP